MTTTKYLPSAWLDEICPDPADKPDDFLHLVDGKWFLWPDDEDQEERLTWSMEIVKGQVIEFSEFRDHGHWTITIDEKRDEDGQPVWRGGEAIDAEANCFYCDDIDDDAFGGTLDELVATMFADNPGICGEFRVHAYRWSTGSHWTFNVVDGHGRLTKTGAIH